MRAERAETDQRLELTVWADEDKLPEYILPGARRHPNIVERFIPVEAGQQITVRGKFEGTTLEASFDLVIDGSFLVDLRIGDKRARHYATRALNFERVYDCPSFKEDWTSKLQPPLDVYEANLFTERIDEKKVVLSKIEDEDRTMERPGVGSIQVVANLKDTELDQRMNDTEWDMEGEGWIYRFKKPVRRSGIKPDYAMGVRHISSHKVPQKRSKTHRNHWNVHPRFGTKPWGRFIFYYRSQEAINKAGCILREDTAQQLDDFTEMHDLSRAAADAYKPDDEDMTGLSPPVPAASRPERSLPHARKFKRLGGNLDLQERPIASENNETESLFVDSDTNLADDWGSDWTGGIIFSRDTGKGKRTSPPAITTNRGTEVMNDHGTDSSTHDARNKTSAAQRRRRSGFLDRLTSDQDPLSHAHSTRNPFTPETDTPGKHPAAALSTSPSTNMAKHDYQRQLVKVPELPEIIELVGPEGISQLELNAYFNNISKVEAWSQSLYAKLRTDFNNRVNEVAHPGKFKVTLKEQYLSSLNAAETPQPDSNAAANMVNPFTDRDARVAKTSSVAADRTNALKRAASKSSTPDAGAIAKKIKTEKVEKAESSHAADMEARRRNLEAIREKTAALLEQAANVKAQKAEKKARKEREKAERRERERQELERAEKEREEAELLAQEEEVLKLQQQAAEAFAQAELEGSDSDSDDESTHGGAFGLQDERRGKAGVGSDED
ncbi:hypothetical protein CBER1_08645 [Cercospora berteroae]|uniref:Uncharacterized protein n=1 Tax=Cercospora berteroae TaxID=357750 RepID=A0A2S6BVP9_9PEZI|nr:hypothetical protein CBER1_08645 [Cercospora berteroae]